MTVETIDKRFCATAVKKGFITAHQVLEALEIQAAENLVLKKRRLIGKILLDLGFVTRPQIEEVLGSINTVT